MTAVLTSFADLSRHGEAGDPDLIMVSVDVLDDAASALLAEQHRRRPRPLVVFTQDASRARIALTRAHLQDELMDIVAETHSTVVMVTHDVDEAVLLQIAL